jgi:sugar phosphate isomerase/epimerase
MRIAVATANFYFIPFVETLEIIASAGYQNIELDLFWGWNQWNMAQHLRDVPVSQVIRAIHRSGLKVTSIHDGGGILPDHNTTAAYINPALDEYLDQLGYAPEYMVFHPPHAVGNLDGDWWQQMSGKILRALEPYRACCQHLTLENMPLFEGFTVPLTTPEELYAFACENKLKINVDTTHYAQIGANLLEAAYIMKDRIHSVHLSDYIAGRSHVFVGEGELDLTGFLALQDPQVFNMVTLECSVSSVNKPDREMNHGEMVDRMKLLKARVESLSIGGP